MRLLKLRLRLASGISKLALSQSLQCHNKCSSKWWMWSELNRIDSQWASSESWWVRISYRIRLLVYFTSQKHNTKVRQPKGGRHLQVKDNLRWSHHFKRSEYILRLDFCLQLSKWQEEKLQSMIRTLLVNLH